MLDVVLLLDACADGEAAQPASATPPRWHLISHLPALCLTPSSPSPNPLSCCNAGRGAGATLHCPVQEVAGQPGAAPRPARVSLACCADAQRLAQALVRKRQAPCCCLQGDCAAVRTVPPPPTSSHPAIPCHPECAPLAPTTLLLLSSSLCSDYLAFRNVSVFKQDGSLQVPLLALLG